MKQLWFERPAGRWNEAWPIGNGRLGGMVAGGIHREILQINEDSMYYGGPVDRVNPDAKTHLEQVRTLLMQGRISRAEELMRYAFTGTPQSQRPYQSLGTVELVYEINKTREGTEGITVQDYSRSLDMEQGIVSEHFFLNGCDISKEYLASYKSGIIAVEIKSHSADISVDALLSRMSGGQYYCDRTGKLDESTILMEGQQGSGGVYWRAGLRARAEGGIVCVCGEHLLIRNARRIMLYLGCETSFYEQDWKKALQERLDRADAAGYEAVRTEHIRDYQQLFQRVNLVLGEENEDKELPSMERIFREKDFGSSFVPLYFQFGRYLLIAGSRPGSLPLNLQGIWNDKMEPPWGCRYTININTEMNYWPAEICSLPECHMPLFDHLIRMWENGRRTAKEMYGCRGFVAHHSTDLWGDCAPQDSWIPSTYWVMGAAWLCTHIWQHYFYTQDLEFLKKFYPVMKDAVLFFHDFLIEIEGTLMTCPSVSPENTFVLTDGTHGCYSAGAAMDTEILRDLMEAYIKASETLEIRDEITKKTQKILEKLPKLEIGSYGQIMEWRQDYKEEEPGHRHISQLYALCPSHQITIDQTPELAKAARITLERRLAYGGGHTGWSCAWIVNFYGRLGDGDKALQNLRKLWENSTFCNLMDNHPVAGGFVFQIDGNMGAVAAITELLVQSREDRIILLPALPKQWHKGSLKGVSVGRGIRMDLEWREGKAASCRLNAEFDRTVAIVYENQTTSVSITAGKAYELTW